MWTAEPSTADSQGPGAALSPARSPSHPGLSPPPRTHLLPPDREGHGCVEVLPSVEHWLPIPKDLCFKVLDHVLHDLPGTRQNSSTASARSGERHVEAAPAPRRCVRRCVCPGGHSGVRLSALVCEEPEGSPLRFIPLAEPFQCRRTSSPPATRSAAHGTRWKPPGHRRTLRRSPQGWDSCSQGRRTGCRTLGRDALQASHRASSGVCGASRRRGCCLPPGHSSSRRPRSTQKPPCCCAPGRRVDCACPRSAEVQPHTPRVTREHLSPCWQEAGRALHRRRLPKPGEPPAWLGQHFREA